MDVVAEETTSVVKELFLHLIEQQGKTDKQEVALPLVTALWFQYENHVPSPPIRIKEDGTEVTNFPDSLALWAGLDNRGRTAVLDAGCNSEQICPAEAQAAVQRYWKGVNSAIRKAEANRPTEEDAKEYVPSFKCKEKVKFGVGNDTARINSPFLVAEVAHTFQQIEYELNFEEGEMAAVAVDA